jgi:uncharacterized membrane protein YdjX (TVP38/TMEM64 family)
LNNDSFEGVQSSGGIRRLMVFVLIAAICLILCLFTPLGRYFRTDAISRLVNGLGYWVPVAILGVGIVSPLLFVPRWPIAFVAGLMYGVVWGTILANVASTLGACLHFVMAKTLLSPVADRLRRRYGIHPRAIPEDKVFPVLFLLRAFPLSNFVATNLLAGALRIRMGTYLTATFFGMIPSTIMYAAWGKLMKKPDPHFYAIAAISLTIMVVGTWIAQKKYVP